MLGIMSCRKLCLLKLVVLLIILTGSLMSSLMYKHVHRRLFQSRPNGPLPLIHVQVFRSSPTFWNEFLNCKTLQNYTWTDHTRFVSCPSSTLEVILSKNVNDMIGADAVLFNTAEEAIGDLMRNVKQLKDMSEQEAYANQAWIYQALEPPTYTRHLQLNVKDLPVHAIMGYLDNSSPVRVVNGYFEPGKPMSDVKTRTPEDWLAAKTKLVVWAARNCHLTFWPRLEYIHELQKHIDVDVYGQCGNLTCLPRMSTDCLVLMQKYKFYLSFENSECEHYVTEKFWNPLIYGMVPIVYGARKEQYINIAPPNSFIYIGDFKSSKDLADYLLHLDRNPKEYLKYFEWRKAGRIVDMFLDHCALCHVPELIANISKGLTKRKLMSETYYYSSCRPQEGRENYEINIKLDTWLPWK